MRIAYPNLSHKFSILVVIGWMTLAAPFDAFADPGKAVVAQDKSEGVAEPDDAAKTGDAAKSDDAEKSSASKTSKVQLPWQKPKKPAISLFDVTARELLVDISDSELLTFSATATFPSDNSFLPKLLYRYNRFDLFQLHQFVKNAENVDDLKVLAENPEANQLEFRRLSGTITSLKKIKLLPEVAELYDFQHFFVLKGQATANTSQTTSSDQSSEQSMPVTLYAMEVPMAWRSTKELNEPFRCTGMFLKVIEPDAGQPTELVFAAQRAEWNPKAANESFRVTESHVLLGEHGFDVGLLDELRQLNGKKVGQQDTESFYQVLAATKSIQKTEIATKSFDLASMYGKPFNNQCDLYTISAEIRRATEIKIHEPFYHRRFGFDKYYQLDAFIRLEKKVNIVDAAGKKLTFENIFPITICLAELPPGVETGKAQRVKADIDCFFFKLWSYKSEFVRQLGKDRTLSSPLMIGIAPESVEIEPPQMSGMTPLLMGGFVLIFGMIWLGYWTSSKSRPPAREEIDEATARKTLKSLEDL